MRCWGVGSMSMYGSDSCIAGVSDILWDLRR